MTWLAAMRRIKTLVDIVCGLSPRPLKKTKSVMIWDYTIYIKMPFSGWILNCHTTYKKHTRSVLRPLATLAKDCYLLLCQSQYNRACSAINHSSTPKEIVCYAKEKEDTGLIPLPLVIKPSHGDLQHLMLQKNSNIRDKDLNEIIFLWV